jgi:hypothetical protein
MRKDAEGAMTSVVETKGVSMVVTVVATAK